MGGRGTIFNPIHRGLNNGRGSRTEWGDVGKIYSKMSWSEDGVLSLGKVQNLEYTPLFT